MSSVLEPTIIQGGMGAGISSWELARAVSLQGQLGVVSGTAMDLILSRRLQDGDPGGHMRRAMAAFPFPEMSEAILDRYFIEGGREAGQPYRAFSMPAVEPKPRQIEMLVVSNFVEVYLAKEGHDGLVGTNFLEKVQLPTLPSLLGAMLADVDYVLMGAGIPRAIPGFLDDLSVGKSVELSFDVRGAGRDDRFVTRLDPANFILPDALPLKRPNFLAIVAYSRLATMLTRKATGMVDGFIVEGPTAGGHNAPPRGKMQRNERGEPIYGERDVVDLAAFREIGRPFWLAGSYGKPEAVAEALEEGAAGVQVGTAFAYCEESRLREDLKQDILEKSRAGEVDVRTDADASPTGFPFKVICLEDTISEKTVYEERSRICDLGYLRHAYKCDDGSIDWRCPSEPVDAYLRKGGEEADTEGRKCVCNSLLANISLGQSRKDGRTELPMITSGDDAADVARFLSSPEATSYSAKDVLDYLLAGVPAARTNA